MFQNIVCRDLFYVDAVRRQRLSSSSLFQSFFSGNVLGVFFADVAAAASLLPFLPPPAPLCGIIALLAPPVVPLRANDGVFFTSESAVKSYFCAHGNEDLHGPAAPARPLSEPGGGRKRPSQRSLLHFPAKAQGGCGGRKVKRELTDIFASHTYPCIEDAV